MLRWRLETPPPPAPARSTFPAPDPRARSRPEARAWVAPSGPAAPASSRSAKPRTAFSGVRRSCASRRASSAAVGGSATWPAAMLTVRDVRATVTTAHPSTGVHPFAGHPWRTVGCAEGRHAAHSRGSSSNMLRLRRLAEINVERRITLPREQRHIPLQQSAEVELAYRRLPLLADYFRGWAGLGLAALPLVTMAPSWPVTLGLVALIGLFVGFLVQTWRRQHSRVLLVPDRRFGDRRRAAPAGLARSRRAAAALVRLAPSGPGLARAGAARWRGQGWCVTSALDRFDDVVAEAVQAAQRSRPAARADHPRQCRGPAEARRLSRPELRIRRSRCGSSAPRG